MQALEAQNARLEDELRDARREIELLRHAQDELKSRVAHQEQSSHQQSHRFGQDLRDTRAVRDELRQRLAEQVEENMKLREALQRPLPADGADRNPPAPALTPPPVAEETREVIEISDDGDLYDEPPSASIKLSPKETKIPSHADHATSLAAKKELVSPTTLPSLKRRLEAEPSNLRRNAVNLLHRFKRLKEEGSSDQAVLVNVQPIAVPVASTSILNEDNLSELSYPSDSDAEPAQSPKSTVDAPPRRSARSRRAPRTYAVVTSQYETSDNNDSEESEESDGDESFASCKSPTPQTKSLRSSAPRPAAASSSSHRLPSSPKHPGALALSEFVTNFAAFPVRLPAKSPTRVTRAFLAATYRVPNCTLTGTIKANHNVPPGTERPMLFPDHPQNPGLPTAPGAPGTLISNREDVTRHGVVALWVKSTTPGGGNAWMYYGQYEVRRSPSSLSGQGFESLSDKCKDAWVSALFKATLNCYALMTARIWLHKHNQDMGQTAVARKAALFVDHAKVQKREKVKEKDRAGPGGLTKEHIRDGLCSGVACFDVVTLQCVGYDYAFETALSTTFAKWMGSKAK
ncbi:hypothetical protein FA95DRAFT_1600476 [Auriscalpium vulgare]|uniref:Uncharacterized protein n=1 Tax=Auriscalpium vulgare TaxID=40419 RepID=A0ACB8SDM5_9AGAM|nr:hypothetical protein FA95DRAFT_1600476 [Auriscalpium vulgare]